MKEKRADCGFVRYQLRIRQNKGFKGKASGGEDGSSFFACGLPGIDIRGKISLMESQPAQHLREPLQGAASDVDRF